MTTTLITALAPEHIATRLADLIMEGEHPMSICAAGAFEQEPPHWRFEAWFEGEGNIDGLMAFALQAFGAAAEKMIFTAKDIDETDWVQKSLDDLPPVRAGRFVVHGAHDRHKLRNNDISIEIEASMAFGTGHHGTTLGCLLELGRWSKRHPRLSTAAQMLDVGTGTGVLAIALAKSRRLKGIAGDLDVEAVRIAADNTRLAGVAHLVRVVKAAGTRHTAMERAAPCPLVVANILAGPLVMLAPSLAKATQHGGTLILSGLLAWQSRRVEAAYFAQGFKIDHRRRIGDWMTLTFIKR